MLYRTNRVQPQANIFPLIPPGFDQGHVKHSTYKQQCYVSGAIRTQREENMRAPSNTKNTEGMYQSQGNNPIQEYKYKMPFEFKWNKRKALHVNPSTYRYAQAKNSILKTINFNL